MYPNSLQYFTSLYSNFEGFIIGIVVNNLFRNMNWSDHVQKNSNDLAPGLAVSYFQTKCDDKLS